MRTVQNVYVQYLLGACVFRCVRIHRVEETLTLAVLCFKTFFNLGFLCGGCVPFWPRQRLVISNYLHG